MATIKEFLSRIRLIYRRTGNVTKIAAAAAIVLCMATLIGLHLSMTALENRTEDMRQKAGLLEEANRELEDKIEELGCDAEIAAVSTLETIYDITITFE